MARGVRMDRIRENRKKIKQTRRGKIQERLNGKLRGELNERNEVRGIREEECLMRCVGE